MNTFIKKTVITAAITLLLAAIPVVGRFTTCESENRAKAYDVPESIQIVTTQESNRDDDGYSGVYLHSGELPPSDEKAFEASKSGPAVPNGTDYLLVDTKTGYAEDGTTVAWYQVQATGINGDGQKYWICGDVAEVRDVYYSGMGNPSGKVVSSGYYYDKDTNALKEWQAADGLNGWYPMYGGLIFMNNVGGTQGVVGRISDMAPNNAVMSGSIEDMSKNDQYLTIATTDVIMRMLPVASDNAANGNRNGLFTNGASFKILAKATTGGETWYQVQTGTNEFSWVRGDLVELSTKTVTVSKPAANTKVTTTTITKTSGSTTTKTQTTVKSTTKMNTNTKTVTTKTTTKTGSKTTTTKTTAKVRQMTK